MTPVVLDLDGALQGMPGVCVIGMREHEQPLRFACSMRVLGNFARVLDERLPTSHGTVLTGSGDFHHVSLPLIRRAAARHESLQVVVFDNHPDNMRFPFGVHCGSWVRRVCELDGVQHVHVVGITSADIGAGHAWENQWRPLRAGRLTYWSTAVDVTWARRFGLAQSIRSFADMSELLQAFAGRMSVGDAPIYLSIDKDVLSVEDAHTNWDQGVMREHQLVATIAALQRRIVASDITGEVSVTQYRRIWKRLLSALDRQPHIPVERLARWQANQQALNVRLLDAIEGARQLD